MVRYGQNKLTHFLAELEYGLFELSDVVPETQGLQLAGLVSSIIDGLPIGSITLWLSSEKETKPSPEPKVKVLDGRRRLSLLYKHLMGTEETLKFCVDTTPGLGHRIVMVDESPDVRRSVGGNVLCVKEMKPAYLPVRSICDKDEFNSWCESEGLKEANISVARKVRTSFYDYVVQTCTIIADKRTAVAVYNYTNGVTDEWS